MVIPHLQGVEAQLRPPAETIISAVIGLRGADQQFMLISPFSGGDESVSTENVDPISAAQCKAARALIDMTQPDLAKAARLGLSTVVDLERNRRAVSDDAIAAIRAALEKAGVIFVEENGEGPGVRLRKKRTR